MIGSTGGAFSPDDLTAHSVCPPWCVSGHGVHLGEEDWLHLGEPLTVARGVLARLCMSVDPGTGAVDGPYVLVGSTEHTLVQAETLGSALVALARSAAGPIRPSAHGTRSPGP